ncbi:MAG: hypothetical protein JNM07_01725 [Phycisphaerae bacterium]|nr:hypothetical protein [Phycisphaerae bacterium]
METAIINGLFGLIGVVIAVVFEEYLRRRWYGRAHVLSRDRAGGETRSLGHDGAAAPAQRPTRDRASAAPGRRRPYEELQAIVEELGGEMRYEKAGRPQGGTWIVSLPGHAEKFFNSNGAGFPPLDRLYVPSRAAPSHYRDYSNELLPDAPEQWISMLRTP